MLNSSPRIRAILPHTTLLACFLAPAVAGLQAPGPGQTRLLTLTSEQQEILSHLSIVYLDDGQGGMVKTIRLSAANLQIVNGLGATNGNPAFPNSVDPMDTVTNGLGNLIIGYNEEYSSMPPDRTGSHNIEVGLGHAFTSFGGVVGGRSNAISGPFASATSGYYNTASGNFSSVSGGSYNEASGSASSVSGGSVNDASGSRSSVSGGDNNDASGYASSVSGGMGNDASGDQSSVSGGRSNLAFGTRSSISGGSNLDAILSQSWAAGSFFYP